jgi:hypothetical protein
MPAGSGHLMPFKFRIIFPSGKRKGSAIHTFYARNQATADHDAKAWARRRGATKLTRVKKGES